jgi:hypothetical protein
MPSSVNDCDGRLEDCRCVYVYCQYVYVYVEGGIGCLLRTKAAMDIGRAPGIYRIVYVCMYKCMCTCMCMCLYQDVCMSKLRVSVYVG